MADDIFLLDTNILSNASKQKPHPVVAQWLRAQTRLAIPFAAILEVETGIVEKSRTDPAKAQELWDWLDGILGTEFEYPVPTPQVARVLGKLMCCRPLTHLWYADPRADRKKPGQDLFIAATSIVYEMPIATLDVKDFEQINEYFPLPGVYNPAFGVWAVPRCYASIPGTTSNAQHGRLTAEATARSVLLDLGERPRNPQAPRGRNPRPSRVRRYPAAAPQSFFMNESLDFPHRHWRYSRFPRFGLTSSSRPHNGALAQ
ncbi:MULTISPECIES: PIN domain-containing protein [unclassified Ensifer]|uniref:PIN domain-containing protein n=1 Tax=unclassified Ensifer TaxID=2633371 RepID=UPI000B333C10|nr:MULTISPECIES: PIN domain-containing protein [unclassified Ensifer]